MRLTVASGPQSSSPIVRVWIQYSHLVGTTGVLPTYTRLPIANMDLVTGWLPSSVSGIGLGNQDIMIMHNYSKPRVITSKEGQGKGAVMESMHLANMEERQ